LTNVGRINLFAATSEFCALILWARIRALAQQVLKQLETDVKVGIDTDEDKPKFLLFTAEL